MECLQCAAELELAPDVELGEIIVCPDCGVEWEVMSTDPITIELAPEVEPLQGHSQRESKMGGWIRRER